MRRSLKNFDSPVLTQNYLELVEDRLSSSGIFSQVLLHWRSSRRSRKTCKIETLSPKMLKIESSSCQCSLTLIGPREEIQKYVFLIPNMSSITRRDSREDIGHSSARETKRSTELSATHLKEMGFYRHTDGGTIQRNRSPSIQERQCFESWNPENGKSQRHHTLQCGFIEHRNLVSHDSHSK